MKTQSRISRRYFLKTTALAAAAVPINVNEAADQRQSGDIATGLVSHWPMDEGTGKVAQDTISANHGVFERGEPEWAEGRTGKGALSFSESCYLNCGQHESLNMTKAMTFAAWIKKSKDGRKSRIASKHGFIDEKNAGWLVLCGGQGKVNIEWRISITGEDWHGGFTAPNSFPYDEWNHLAVTYDGAVRSCARISTGSRTPAETFRAKKAARFIFQVPKPCSGKTGLMARSLAAPRRGRLLGRWMTRGFTTGP